jgi:SAM-dependent methyltransferase
MYLALASESRGGILELCAGSGRISIPLAAAGHAVTAVDHDPDMLDRARAEWESHSARKAGGGTLTLIEHDVTLLDLPDRFDLVILALNSLLLLDGRDAQLAALRTMARHVAPDGTVVIDVWLPGAADLELYDGRVILDWVRRDHDRQEWVAKLTSARHDPDSETARITTIFDSWQDGKPADRTMRQDTAHLLGRDKLTALLVEAGLSVDVLASDYSFAPFEAGGDRLVVICRGGRSYGGQRASD